jgi:hypothetical protein
MRLALRLLVALSMAAAACTTASEPVSPSPDQTPPDGSSGAQVTPRATSIPTPVPTSGCSAADVTASGLDGAFSLGGTAIDFRFLSARARDVTLGAWSDLVPAPPVRWAGGGTHQEVIASAGAVLRLHSNDKVLLVGSRAETYRLDGDGALSEDAMPDATVELDDAPGTLDVPLPTEVGRWLLSLYLRWETACATGDGYFDLDLETLGPPGPPPLTDLEQTIITALDELGLHGLRAQLPFENADIWVRIDAQRELGVSALPVASDGSEFEVVATRRVGAVDIETGDSGSVGGEVHRFECGDLRYYVGGHAPPPFVTVESFIDAFLGVIDCPPRAGT